MLFLALRQLLSKKRQTFLILFGISLGVTIYVLISGMQLGFREYLVDQLVNNDAQIKISAHEEVIEEKAMTEIFYGGSGTTVFWQTPPSGKRDSPHILYPQGWFQRLATNPDVIGYSPQLQTQVLAARGNIRASAQMIGIKPEMHKRVATLEKYVKDGKLSDLGESGNRVIVGDGLLEKLGARVSETLLIAAGTSTPRPFKIVGSFHVGLEPLDNSTLYGSLSDVQALNGTPGRITTIGIRIADVDEAGEIADRWALLADDKVESWDEANANFLDIFRIQDIVRNVITGAILAVAGFGIYNVLTIIISQKRREIAILRSLGYTPNQILKLFLLQGLILGFAGAAIGLILGFLACLYTGSIDIDVMGQQGFIISYSPMIYIVGFAMAMVSALIASYLPARSASRMTPIEIIRSDA